MIDVRVWLAGELELARNGTDGQGKTRTMAATIPSEQVLARPCSSPVPVSARYAANAVLSLLNLACYQLDRQLASQAATFEKEGGFTERLYRVRSGAPSRKPGGHR